jgi:hypothetical protein
MLKVELKNSGKKHMSGDDIYYLYIDNKTDAFPYDSHGEAAFISTREAEQKHLEILCKIPCEALPNGMKLWNEIHAELAIGQICVFHIKKWRHKTKMGNLV